MVKNISWVKYYKDALNDCGDSMDVEKYLKQAVIQANPSLFLFTNK